VNQIFVWFVLQWYGTVYENKAKSILGLPQSAGNKRNRQLTLPILILYVEKEHFHFSEFYWGSSNRPQDRNRDQTYGKRVEIFNFRLGKLAGLVQCDWHIVPVGEEVEHVVRVHGPKVGNACREK
jgi:hypothetical protein